MRPARTSSCRQRGPPRWAAGPGSRTQSGRCSNQASRRQPLLHPKGSRCSRPPSGRSVCHHSRPYDGGWLMPWKSVSSKLPAGVCMRHRTVNINRMMQQSSPNGRCNGTASWRTAMHAQHSDDVIMVTHTELNAHWWTLLNAFHLNCWCGTGTRRLCSRPAEIVMLSKSALMPSPSRMPRSRVSKLETTPVLMPAVRSSTCGSDDHC